MTNIFRFVAVSAVLKNLRNLFLHLHPSITPLFRSTILGKSHKVPDNLTVWGYCKLKACEHRLSFSIPPPPWLSRESTACRLRHIAWSTHHNLERKWIPHRPPEGMRDWTSWEEGEKMVDPVERWTLGLIETPGRQENHLVHQSTSSQLARLSLKTLQIV